MRFLIPALVGIALIGGAALAADDPATITMSGTGSVSVVPDRASVSLGVVTVAPTAGEAISTNSPAVARVIAMLKDSGVPAEAIATERVDVSPRYARQQNETPEITGYQVTNSVRAELPDIAGLGEILDRAIAAGATSVGGIRMTYSDTQGALDEARARAVRDATRKAEVAAGAAGLILGDILSISEGGGGGPLPRPVGARAMAMEAVPIEAGSSELSARIMIVWELEDED
ncbi:MAG: SIMPL domain-containing protein [Pseudomonadota bacterium]